MGSAEIARLVLRKLIEPLTLHGKPPGWLQARICAYDLDGIPEENSQLSTTGRRSAEAHRVVGKDSGQADRVHVSGSESPLRHQK